MNTDDNITERILVEILFLLEFPETRMRSNVYVCSMLYAKCDSHISMATAIGGAAVTHIVVRGNVLQLQFDHMLKLMSLKHNQVCEHVVRMASSWSP